MREMSEINCEWDECSHYEENERSQCERVSGR